MLSATFAELVDGKIVASTRLDDERLEKIRSMVPADLASLYDQVGLCTLKAGRLQLCDPLEFRGILALIFKGDSQFSHNDCHAFAYTSFGMLYCWSNELALVVVDLITGHVTSRGALGKIKAGANISNQIYVPFSLSDEALDLSDEDGKPLFLRAAKKLGALQIGECFGFVPALALGGTRRLEHLKRIRALEHFAIVAQTLEFQLVDVQGYGEETIVRSIG
ncbi:T6SS immunity protein Tdi1 domain-containing protein [Rhizobium panacihumi]|uniref:T6SS immunity protein Tdi1 domain-containing protein n=1 Tax=Rhizobium panacihumi TaxID=2008450 RepID=UPI003D7B1AA7